MVLAGSVGDTDFGGAVFCEGAEVGGLTSLATFGLG
jgi:hypothetical protein